MQHVQLERVHLEIAQQRPADVLPSTVHVEDRRMERFLTQLVHRCRCLIEFDRGGIRFAHRRKYDTRDAWLRVTQAAARTRALQRTRLSAVDS